VRAWYLEIMESLQDMSHVAVIANPVSGAGHSKAVAGALAQRLRGDGYEVVEVPTRLEDARSWLDPALEEASAALVVGGDGTVRLVAESVVRTETPTWQVPCGTENLLARTLGMSADYSAICSAMEQGQVEQLDVARANGVICLLMASCGFDAAVVHDLASRRRKSIRHWHYLPCILRQLWRWRPVSMTLKLDGRMVREHEAGWCFICNSAEYGARFNPAPDADMTDGLLDVVFLPTRSRFQVLRWMHRARRGDHLRFQGSLHARANHVQLEFEPDCPWQVDGDPPAGRDKNEESRLDVQCLPGRFSALLPLSKSP